MVLPEKSFSLAKAQRSQSQKKKVYQYSFWQDFLDLFFPLCALRLGEKEKAVPDDQDGGKD